MNESLLRRIDWLLLPLVGAGFVLAVWAVSSSTWAKELPSPLKTWQASKPYILEPFAKRGEMDQGILRFTWYSLVLVAKGYALALIIGTPIGFFLGLSKLPRIKPRNRWIYPYRNCLEYFVSGGLLGLGGGGFGLLR